MDKFRLVFLFGLFVSFSLSAAQLPDGWPWKGVDVMAYVIESDPQAIKFIIANKIKYVRIHIFKKKTMSDFKVSGQQALAMNLRWAKKINDELNTHEINSFITIADFPVSLTECTNKKKTSYWDSKSCIDQIYYDVNETVEYFKHSNILGYEFLGEPVVVKKNKSIRPENWGAIFRNIIKMTRKIDKTKWLFYSPGPWGLPVKYADVVPFEDERIIYNAHMYLPHNYTHQGIREKKNLYAYPGWVRFRYWDKGALENSLKPLIGFQKKYRKPISISEFSAVLWAEGNNKYLDDLIVIFNTHQWSWMYFNIGSDYKGWDARFEAKLDETKKKNFTDKGNKSSRFIMLKKYLPLAEGTKNFDKNSLKVKGRNEASYYRK